MRHSIYSIKCNSTAITIHEFTSKPLIKLQPKKGLFDHVIVLQAVQVVGSRML